MEIGCQGGTQVKKKGREPLMDSIKRESKGFLTPASDVRCHLNSFCPTVPTHGALARLGSLIAGLPSSAASTVAPNVLN